jgi:hypothetical protein
MRQPSFRTTIKIAALAAVLSIGTAGSAFADMISATLNAVGTVDVSGNGQTGGCINWSTSTTCPTSGSGSYTVVAPSTAPFVDGQTGSIDNLNFNVTYPVTDFITYGSGPGTVDFDWMDIRSNTSGAAIGNCTSDAPDVSCTPAGSIFTITDGPADSQGQVDTVTVAITADLEGYTGSSGVDYSNATSYVGVFTTQAISGDITDILDTIADGGNIPASFSVTIGGQSAATPEPGSASLLLLGIGLIVVGVRRKTRLS